MNVSSTISLPAEDEYAQYYGQYIACLGEVTDFLEMFGRQAEEFAAELDGLNEETASILHEPYTWTIKQVVGHLIDCERIFGSRFMRIAVGDETPIPGIDQNQYVDNVPYDAVTLAELLQELVVTRRSNYLLAKRVPVSAMERMGTASDNPVSARANLYIIAGHLNYHMKIIRSRISS